MPFRKTTKIAIAGLGIAASVITIVLAGRELIKHREQCARKQETLIKEFKDEVSQSFHYGSHQEALRRAVLAATEGHDWPLDKAVKALPKIREQQLYFESVYDPMGTFIQAGECDTEPLQNFICGTDPADLGHVVWPAAATEILRIFVNQFSYTFPTAEVESGVKFYASPAMKYVAANLCTEKYERAISELKADLPKIEDVQIYE